MFRKLFSLWFRLIGYDIVAAIQDETVKMISYYLFYFFISGRPFRFIQWYDAHLWSGLFHFSFFFYIFTRSHLFLFLFFISHNLSLMGSEIFHLIFIIRKSNEATPTNQRNWHLPLFIIFKKKKKSALNLSHTQSFESIMVDAWGREWKWKSKYEINENHQELLSHDNFHFFFLFSFNKIAQTFFYLRRQSPDD